jgi:sporadic carbohydrate cluster 2OG-Fe(II) oxygenase
MCTVKPGLEDPIDGFLSPEEAALGRRFLADGYVIRAVEDAGALDRIRLAAAGHAARHLGVAAPNDAGDFLNRIHEQLPVAKLNDLRLAVFHGLNAEPWFRRAYFTLARRAIETLVGNELAMQRRINLSIQMPDDDSSLLPVHADVWSGDSPFEVVAWLPLVDCRKTKSMFLLPPAANARHAAQFGTYSKGSAEDLFHAIEPELTWLDIKYGEVLLFTQNLMHGNRVNREGETRWSMNCRFKSLFSPYSDKRLGEFFEPITIRAASRLGMDYRHPTGFEA